MSTGVRIGGANMATAEGEQGLVQPQANVATRLFRWTIVTLIVGALGTFRYFHGWYDRFCPPAISPDVVKRYQVRPKLPISYVLR